MKLFLSAICLLLVSCGATDLSGTYVCNEVFFSSQTMNPTEISENQNAAQSDLIGSSITVVQYDDSVWIGFSETDGNHNDSPHRIKESTAQRSETLRDSGISGCILFKPAVDHDIQCVDVDKRQPDCEYSCRKPHKLNGRRYPEQGESSCTEQPAD